MSGTTGTITVSSFTSALAGAALGTALQVLISPDLAPEFFMVLTIVSVGALWVSYLQRQVATAVLLTVLCFWIGLGIAYGAASRRPGQNPQPTAIAQPSNTPNSEYDRPIPAKPTNEPPIQSTNITSIASVSASSSADPSADYCGKATYFTPNNVNDGREDTAWRVKGNGKGETITLSFGREVVVQEIIIVPGYAKVDPCKPSYNWCELNYVPKEIMFVFSDGASGLINLPRICGPQSFSINPITTSTIEFKIMDSHPHNGREFTPISEITVIGYIK